MAFPCWPASRKLRAPGWRLGNSASPAAVSGTRYAVVASWKRSALSRRPGAASRHASSPLPSSRGISACLRPAFCSPLPAFSVPPADISARLQTSGRVLGRRPNAQRFDTPPVRYAASWLALGPHVAYCVASLSAERLAGTVTFPGHSHTSCHCLLRGVSHANGQHLALGVMHFPGQRLQDASHSLSASVLCAASRVPIASVSDASSSKWCLAHVVLRIPVQRLLRGLSREPARNLMRSFSCAPAWRLVRHRVASYSPLGRVSCAVSRTRPDGVSFAVSHAPQDGVRLPRHLERGVTRAPGRHLMRSFSRTAASFAWGPMQASCERCLASLAVSPTSTGIVLRVASQIPGRYLVHPRAACSHSGDVLRVPGRHLGTLPGPAPRAWCLPSPTPPPRTSRL